MKMKVPKSTVLSGRGIVTKTASAERRLVRLNAGFNLGGDGDRNTKRLIIPSQKHGMDKPSKGAGPGVVGFVQEGDGAEDRNKFLLPKNFMERAPGQEDAGKEEEENELGVEDMLNILTERTDVWHKLARYITLLKREGIGSEIIDDMAGIDALGQNLYVVGSNVYKTLEERGVAEDILAFYSNPGAEKLLYPIRVMTAQDRQTIGEYVCQNDLDEHQCEELVRSMREHSRRTYDDDRLKFEYNPGDCLAYKYYRDAIEETRNADKKTEIVQKGLKRATSKLAIETLEELLLEKDEEEVQGRIPVVELDEDEFDSIILSIAGSFDTLTSKELKDASRTNKKGPFGILTPEKAGEQWVSLPLFQPLVTGFDMVAITVDNMMALKAFGAQTGGPGIIVVDRRLDKSQIDLQGCYAITIGDDQAVSFVSGQDVMSQAEIVGEDKLDVVGKVSIGCKPPGKKKADLGDAISVVDSLPSSD